MKVNRTLSRIARLWAIAHLIVTAAIALIAAFYALHQYLLTEDIFSAAEAAPYELRAFAGLALCLMATHHLYCITSPSEPSQRS